MCALMPLKCQFHRLCQEVAWELIHLKIISGTLSGCDFRTSTFLRSSNTLYYIAIHIK